MDYGLLGGLGEGLQKGVAAYMEGRKLKKSEEQDAEKMALARRESKLKELEIAGKLMEAGVDIPKGMFSAETESAITGGAEQTPPVAPPNVSQMSQQSGTPPQPSMGFLSPPAGFKTKKVKEAEKQLPQLQLSAMDKGLEPFITASGEIQFRPLSSKTPEMTRKEKKENIEIAKGMKDLGGKDVPATEAVGLGGATASFKALEDVSALLEGAKDLIGPGQGLLSKGAAYFQLGDMGERAATLDAELKSRAQTIGKYLEGGKLTNEDIERYKASLPLLTDSLTVAKNKIKNLQRLIAQKQESEKLALSEAGYKSQGITTPAVPSLQTTPQRSQGLLPEAEASKTEFVIMTKPGQKPLRVPLSDVDDAKREGWTPKGAK